MAEEEVEEKGGSKMIIIIGAVVALGGGGAFMMLGGDKGDGDDAKKTELKVEMPIQKMKDEITVTYAGEEGGPTYLLLRVSYQTSSEAADTILANKEPMIRDKLNTYLITLTKDAISGSSGIDNIRSKIYTIMSNVIQDAEMGKEDKLEYVFITKYIVQ